MWCTVSPHLTHSEASVGWSSLCVAMPIASLEQENPGKEDNVVINLAEAVVS